MRTEDAGEPWLVGPLAYVILASLVGVARGQSTIYTFYGDQSQDDLGTSVDGIGDMDHDGYADFVVGIRGGGSFGKARVYSGRLGLLLHEFVGSGLGGNFGSAVSGAGDVNGDGWPDVMVADPSYDSPFGNAGSTWVYSGRSGLQLHQFKGSKTMALSGAAIDSAGDVDKDGYADIIVGAYNDGDLASGQGSVRVFSGQTGGQIHLFWGDPVASQGAGWAVAGVGDIDGDGYDDVAYGARLGNYVRVRSGADGSVLREWTGMLGTFGHAVSGAGDVDADGTPDIIVGDPLFSTSPPPIYTAHGAAHVFSGASGDRLHSFIGVGDHDYFGWAVAGAGDLDADGYPDQLVGSAAMAFVPHSQEPGYLRTFSGQSGQMLFEAKGKTIDDGYGGTVSGAGDINADGTPDVIVGAFLDSTISFANGSAMVLSGKPLPLVADIHTCSTSLGAVQSFRLDAGSSHATSLYLLLGSTGGTMPGIGVDSVVLPLNPDNYTFFTLANPNQPPLSGSLGLLSPSGVALGSLTLPPGFAVPFAGKTLHHAYLLLEGGQVSFTSNSVSLFLMP